MDETEDTAAFERAVSSHLRAGVHERRQMSAARYRTQCRELWDACDVDEVTPYRLLIDDLMTLDDRVMAGAYDYDDDRIKDIPPADSRSEPTLRCVAAGLVDAAGRPANDRDSAPTDDEESTADASAPKPYMIGFFDVLGFKSWLEREELAAVHSAYRSLMEQAVVTPSMRCLGIHETAPGTGVPTLFALPAEHAYFSDTIVVWVPLVRLFVAPFNARCADLVCESLAMGIPLRGAIAIGEAVMDKTTGTYLGPAIVEAAELEHAQDWLGASLGPSAAWPEFQRALDPTGVMLYDAPLKRETEPFASGLVLDWPRRWRERTGNDDLVAAIDRIDRDDRFGRYYQHARAFAAYSLANPDWYKHIAPSVDS